MDRRLCVEDTLYKKEPTYDETLPYRAGIRLVAE
jgi:hypothetical protein